MKKTKLITTEKSDKPVFHRAAWILVDPWHIIENGSVEVRNNRIVRVHNKKLSSGNVIDHGPGVLMSPLINAHLHLELSALHNQISFENGFAGWVKILLDKRSRLSEDQIESAIRDQAYRLCQKGILWVGDIASLDIISLMRNQLGLKGFFFKEFLGTQIPEDVTVENKQPCLSVAGHAPHTTSPKVLKNLKALTLKHKLPFSIHLAESDVESQFIRDRRGDWANFLIQRGIDYHSWDIQAKTPVGHAHQMGILDERTIAVHLLNVNEQDLQLIAESGAKVCLCPRSNYNLHQKLPDLMKMIKCGIQPALGTDSLASCSSLDIFDEMGYVYSRYPDLDPRIILAMGTVYGARALGIENVAGTLGNNLPSDMVYSPVIADNEKTVVERLVGNEY